MIPDLPLPAATLAVAAVVTAAAAFTQGVVGFGFAILSVPLLALVDARLVPVPQLLVTLPMTLVMLRRERAAFDREGFAWVIAGRVPGAALGVLLLAVASPRAVSLWLGASVLLAVGMLAMGRTLPRTRSASFAVGVVSGIMAYVAAIGGPPLAMLYGERSAPTLRATLAAVFAIGSVLTVAARLLASAVTPLDGWLALLLLGPLALGLALSRPVAARLSTAVFRRAVLLMAGLSGAAVFLRELAGGAR